MRRGRWIDLGAEDWIGSRSWECSECRTIYTVDEDQHIYYDCGWNYCPCCGAMMEAGDAEGLSGEKK